MKNTGMPKVRAISQLFFWALFITIIVLTRETSENTEFLTSLPRFSPYLGITLLFTAGEFIVSYFPALILLVLTLFLGRFFCGWICPLGSTIDTTDRITAPAKKKGKAGGRSLRSYKYSILGITVLLAIFGIQIAGVIDPLSLSIRSYGTVLYAYFDTASKIFFEALHHVPVVNAISEPVYSLFRRHLLDLNETQYYNHLPVFFLFIAVLLISVFGRRFWCRALCPLGAVYALTSRLSFFRRIVNPDKCTNCLKCVNDCRMKAIHNSGLSTYQGECIKCFDCLESCKFDAIEFKFKLPFKKNSRNTPPAIDEEPYPLFTRKRILVSLISAIFAIPILKRKPVYTMDHSALIRPPGALKEQDFINTCVRCGQCMKVCPTNALHPSLFEYGVDAVFTPRLIPRIGSCELYCNQCSEVCPSGAIRKITKKEKTEIVIGTAYLLKDLCLPWAEQKECLVCEEMCPTPKKAIVFKEEYQINKQGKKVLVKLPVVIEELCIGCGICENKCPVPGSAAVKVRTPKTISPGSSYY